MQHRRIRRRARPADRRPPAAARSRPRSGRAHPRRGSGRPRRRRRPARRHSARDPTAIGQHSIGAFTPTTRLDGERRDVSPGDHRATRRPPPRAAWQSIAPISACACGERRTAACSVPGARRDRRCSGPRPVSSAASSTRGIERPTQRVALCPASPSSRSAAIGLAISGDDGRAALLRGARTGAAQSLRRPDVSI